MEKSVVMIRGAGQEFDFVTPWKPKAMSQGVGSGFIIEDNKILTNAHNVSNNKYRGAAKRRRSETVSGESGVHRARLRFGNADS